MSSTPRRRCCPWATSPSTATSAPAKRQSPDDPTFSPLSDSDFSGLPPTVIITAECDPLSSDGETYRDRIVAAGGKAWWHEEPRLVHSFLRARTTVPAAAEAFARIASAVAALGNGRCPY